MPLALFLDMRQTPRPVLVVDDDDDIRAAERQLLRDNGFRVVEARDGAEALWFMQHDPPALVVLDVQMPGVDGPAFARELRMGLRHVPLVILTAAADPRHEADRCNAEAFLAKPFDSDDLLRMVKKFVS
jgi:CheY-like chemotaxis protein